MNMEINQAAPEPLLRLPEADRARLGEALQELLAHGSILGIDTENAELVRVGPPEFRLAQGSRGPGGALCADGA